MLRNGTFTSLVVVLLASFAIVRLLAQGSVSSVLRRGD